VSAVVHINTPLRRLLIAFDASAPSLAALEAAAALSVSLEAPLLGLFVEDLNLLRLAGLPFARVFSANRLWRRSLTVSEMERVLRAQAALAEEIMRRQLAGHPLPWSFRRVRGELAAELLAAAREVDLVVLGCRRGVGGGLRLGPTARTLLTRLSQPLLITGEQRLPRHRPVWVYFEGSAASLRALALAAGLVPRLGGPLLLAGPTPALAQAEPVLEAHAQRGVSVRLVPLPPDDNDSLAAAIKAEGAGMLVLAAGVLSGEAALERLIAQLPCPVLVVRGEGEPPL
jgi:nucleotide-binding universal stress UspA family protein